MGKALNAVFSQLSSARETVEAFESFFFVSEKVQEEILLMSLDISTFASQYLRTLLTILLVICEYQTYGES